MKWLMMTLVLCTSWQNIPGCGAGKGEKTGQGETMPLEQNGFQKVYVEQAESAASLTAGEEMILNVSGNLPSPAYKLERIDVKITGDVIELTPLASFDRKGMAAQMLVPFTESVKVKVAKAGEYTVRLIGRGENRESKITIK